MYACVVFTWLGLGKKSHVLLCLCVDGCWLLGAALQHMRPTAFGVVVLLMFCTGYRCGMTEVVMSTKKYPVEHMELQTQLSYVFQGPFFQGASYIDSAMLHFQVCFPVETRKKEPTLKQNIFICRPCLPKYSFSIFAMFLCST